MMTEDVDIAEVQIKEEIFIEYNCCVCNQGFEFESDLSKHVKLHEEDTASSVIILNNGVCKDENDNNRDLSKQTKNLLNNNFSFNCKICGKIYDTKRGIVTHTRFHHKKHVYNCDKCPVSYQTKKGIIAHVVLHLKGFEKTFPKEKKASNKRIIKRFEGDFECEICHRKFKVKQNFENHALVHSNIRPHKCSLCEASFKTVRNLKEHQIIIHSDIKVNKCSQCPMTFKAIQNLKRHQRIHLDEKPYKCEVCSRCFKEKRYLQDHMRVHSKLKPYKCEECDLAFKDKRGVKRHMKVHSGVNAKSYSKVRGQTFKETRDLNSEPTLYKCKVCDRAFLHRYSVRNHMKIHSRSEVKPFSCDLCGQARYEKRYIRKHMMVHLKG